MFHPLEITLAVSSLGIWFLLPIAIIVPVDVIVIGTLLLVATNARRRVMESAFWPGTSGGSPYRRSKYGFYVDPNDSRLWVPRPQNPRSRTINLGHPRGLRAFALFILALVLAPTLILTVVFLILSFTLP
jgi:uncharacterized membrane protein